jgi:hypothetical protein
MRKRLLALLLAATALTAAGVAYSSATPDGLPNHDVVFGGGKFDFPGTTLVRNFGVTARRDGERGEGTLQYQRFRVEITCVRIDGNAAVIGGILRASPDGAGLGIPASMYFVDNGPAVGQNVGGDMVSALDLFGPGENAGALPGTCPAADPSLATQPLYSGDIVVHAGQ